MNTGKLVFAQVMAHLPLTTFRRCVARYDGEHKVKHFTCLDQYVLVAILKKRLNLSASLYEILQILSLTMFERTPLDQLLARIPPSSDLPENPNQLILFD